MPISGGKYVAPVWVDNAPPALDAAELQAISDSTASYADPFEQVPNLVRPNLLDNWYFVGGGSQQGGGQFPINSSGLTSYQVNGVGTIDRWISQNSTSVGNVGLVSTGITLTHAADGGYLDFQQNVSNVQSIYGKTVTVSAIIDNALYSDTFTVGQTGSKTWGNLSMHRKDPGSSNNYRVFALRSQTTTGATVQAVKLELGSTQTLARQENGAWVLNEIPNFDEQFMRCATLPGVPSRVESGSYVGTGTYGSGNPNSLTFGFVPKTVIVKTEATAAYFLYALAGSQSARSGVSSSAATLTWSGNTLQWYSSSAISQMNTSGTTYYYVAIG